MAINVITEDRASGAQVIDGSLKFDGNSCLTRTFSSSGDRRTWTWSGWAKKSQIPTDNTNYALFGVYSDSNNRDVIRISGTSQDSFEFQNGVSSDYDSTTTSAKFRGTGWYHFVVSVDTDQSTQVDRVKIYVNGELQDLSASPQATRDTLTNHNILHFIGARSTDGNPAIQWEGYMSQVYFVDGQQLAPTEFGFTDLLTNTWRPKKYEGTFGTNGFYLPMDGNSPIGEDQSGNNNDWTPTGFGGSNIIEKATGALPILNTTQGGSQAGVGVRTDAYYANIALAVPFVGNTDDVSHLVNSSQSQKADTNTGSTATNALSNFYSGSRDFDGSNDTCSFASVGACGSGDWTVEFWLYSEDSSQDNVFRRIVSTGTNATSAIQIGHIGTGARDGGYITYTHSDNSVYAVNTSKVTNRWAHIAVVRESGSVNVYTDGIKGTTADSDTNNKTGTTWYVSGYGGDNTSNPGGRFNGKIQDLRVYPGIAKYTSNFIPAAARDPDIVPDTPSGVSGGSKLTKITEGAVTFDGSGDYLSGFGGSAILPTSTGTAFVVDCFWYSNGNSSQKGIWEQHSSGSGRTAYFVNDGSAYLISEGNTVGTFTYGDNRWYFTRIIYDGSGNIYHYVDGVLIGSGTQSNGIDDTGFQIGAYSTDCFNGFISNFRIVVGSNSLSGTDIPTAPLTNITNTSLLCCQSPTSATTAAVTPGSITANGDAAATNFNPFNTDINTVRGQETGYATLNPLIGDDGLTNVTLSNGNLTFANSDTSYRRYVPSNISMPLNTGKYYFEGIYTKSPDSNNAIYDSFGLIDTALAGGGKFGGSNVTGVWVYRRNGYKNNQDAGNNNPGETFGDSWGVGDVIGISYDSDNGIVSGYKNGVKQGDIATDVSVEVSFLVAGYRSCIAELNFGQKPFKFPPPDGFQPLNSSTVRPSTVITRPDRYVGAITYEGITESPRTISLPITPDLIWVKNRDDSSGHYLLDTVRGDNKNLRSDDTYTESAVSGASHGIVSTIGYNSFTVKDGSSSGNNVGSTGTDDFVAWFWKAGGNKGAFNKDDVGYASASAAGLTAGDASEVTGSSVGTKQGFSIISYTSSASDDGSAQIPHGLSQTPDFVLIKNRDTGTSSQGWPAWHSGIPDKSRYLDSGNAWDATEFSYFFNNTAPTSTVVSVSSNSAVSSANRYRSYGGSDKFIMYVWHNVPGLQKFGTYEGNNDSNGPFVELGFNPSIIWTKSMDGSGKGWEVHWNSGPSLRQNPQSERLMLNETASKATTNHVDFLSNGFKIRNTFSGMNNAAETWLYCAWADVPAFNLYGAQSNAR